MKAPGSLFSMHVDEATLDEAWKGIGARRARTRRVRRVAWIATAPIVAALAIFVLFVFRHVTPGQQHQQLPPAAPQVIALSDGAPLPQGWQGASSKTIAFDDGSHAELSPDARLTTAHEHQRDPSHVDLVQEAGVVTFDIKPGGPRSWIIDAGNGTIVRVLGTRFTVMRNRDRVHVSVARGKVRVENAHMEGGGRDLTAGQDVDVPIPVAVAAIPDAIPEHNKNEAPVVAVGNLASAPPTTATVHTARILSAPMPTATTDPMAEADAARKAGRPREAVAILTSVVDGRDPRAALAAFTLGKIHAEELSEPSVAATWFERASRLGLPSGLDEDAHARVVECYGQAGRADDAARAAERYEAKFRDGRHLARVKRWKRD